MTSMSHPTFGAARNDAPPEPRSVMEQLLEAFRDPSPDLNRIVALIAGEPKLQAEVMRRSNSVAFGGNTPAEDLFEALCRIGISEAFQMVTSYRRPPVTRTTSSTHPGSRLL